MLKKVMNTQQLIIDAARASHTFYQYTDAQLTVVLQDTAAALLNEKEAVLKANAQDLARMDVDDPKYDRLKLTESRLKGMADDMRNVASLSSPVGKILNEAVRPNGMVIRKVSVPFGVIGIIYEARPNVTFDVFSLCLKSGNVCVLKGGSEAEDTNLALVSIIRRVLEKHGLNPAVCTLLPAIREATAELLNAVGLVDLLIPRGSSSLINYVRSNALIPVIETGAGVCHTYFDKTGDKEKARAIVNNAKTRRVSVCNALDCLLINEQRLPDLPYICEELIKSGVEIFADGASYETLSSGNYPPELLKQARPESYGTEFLDYKMSIRTVADVAGAVEHIARYSSKHSECIITESPAAIRYFEQAVDAACIYANVSTAFTDGAQFGLGAEIGISTQKLHARGPMGLRELTTYKYIIEGNGQTRN